MGTETAVVRKVSPKCRHNRFVVDPSMSSVECALCGEHLNPMWVLLQMADRESRMISHVEYLEALAEKAEKKNRCKCQHCKKMTPIERRG